MSAVRVALILLVLPLRLLAGETDSPSTKVHSPGDATETSAPVVRLAPQALVADPRPLRYNLLSRRGDLQPGNAATLWIRAGQAARDLNKRLNYDWVSPAGTPLKDLPKKEVRAVLDSYAQALRLAEQAAHRERCEWEIPTFQIENWDFPYAELQGCRELAQALSVRFRLELSEGDFDNAARTLRTGFALARHLGDADTLIQNLVGIAIATVMFGHVEEWMQVPGSPNLYWSLTALPVPFIDVRRAMEFEFSNLDRAIPQLRRLRDGASEHFPVETMTAEMSAFIAAIARLERHEGHRPAEWEVRLGMAFLAAKFYPDARRQLLAAGYKSERVDAMSPVQVVLVDFLDQNDQYRDHVLKALSLPPWQGHAQMEMVAKDVRRLREQVSNPFVTLLFPAVHKVYDARVRLERTVAGLRCAEALRLYAAAHDGKAPIKFTDITTVPLPIDPFTGKGFEGFYSSGRDGSGVLDVPPKPPSQVQLGRRFAIGPSQ
jgi:hypothetical protein